MVLPSYTSGLVPYLHNWSRDLGQCYGDRDWLIHLCLLLLSFVIVYRLSIDDSITKKSFHLKKIFFWEIGTKCQKGRPVEFVFYRKPRKKESFLSQKLFSSGQRSDVMSRLCSASVLWNNFVCGSSEPCPCVKWPLFSHRLLPLRRSVLLRRYSRSLFVVGL